MSSFLKKQNLILNKLNTNHDEISVLQLGDSDSLISEVQRFGEKVENLDCKGARSLHEQRTYN